MNEYPRKMLLYKPRGKGSMGKDKMIWNKASYGWKRPKAQPMKMKKFFTAASFIH
jgi:hypothetical protein